MAGTDNPALEDCLNWVQPVTANSDEYRLAADSWLSGGMRPAHTQAMDSVVERRVAAHWHCHHR